MDNIDDRFNKLVKRVEALEQVSQSSSKVHEAAKRGFSGECSETIVVSGEVQKCVKALGHQGDHESSSGGAW